MDSIDINGLAQQIATRAMEQARAIIDSAFDGVGSANGKLTATISIPAAVTVKRGRPVARRTLKAIEMLRGGARNTDVAKALGMSDQHVSYIRRQHIKAA